MDHLNKPMPFTPNKNQIGKDWQVWKQEFLTFLRLSKAYENYTEENRALLLMNLMGSEAFKAKEQMTFNHPNEEKDMDILLMKFDEIFDPPLNIVKERYNFFSRRIGKMEDIDNYVMDLKAKASKCEFGSQTNKFIIDMVILNMDSYLQKIIFPLDDITLSDIVQYYKQYALNNQKVEELSRNISANETQSRHGCWRCGTRHQLGHCPAYGKTCRVCQEKHHYSGLCRRKPSDSKSKENNNNSNRICSKCGTNHPFKECPAYNVVCNNCSMKGHYTNRCKETKPLNECNKIFTARTNIKLEGQKILYCLLCETKHAEGQCKHNAQKIVDCLWCETKHVQGQCKHNAHCTRCDLFPHNICFQCKKNPHESNCYYKSIVTLPLKNTTQVEPPRASSSNSNNTNTQNCLTCGGQSHGIFPCPKSNLYCHYCREYGHKSEHCSLNSFTFLPTSGNPSQNNSKKDEIKQNFPTQSQYQRRNESTTTNNTTNSQSFRNNIKRNNEKKPDACSIS